MQRLSRPCGAKLAYEVKGSGFPVLLLAPGGMGSCVANWANSPYDPWARLPTSRLKLIAMDQRNGGRSTGPLLPERGWQTFTDDQLALLDHLGVERCHLVGSCIGPSYALRLMREQPHRFASAVMLQPIGIARHTTEPGLRWRGENTIATSHWFGHWARGMAAEQRAAEPELDTLFAAMFKSPAEFVFSVSRDDVRAVRAPMLVLMGDDLYHPSETAREIVALNERATLLERWKGDDATVDATAARVEAFLEEHGSRVE